MLALLLALPVNDSTPTMFSCQPFSLQAVFGESISVAATYTNTHPTVKPASKVESDDGDDQTTATNGTSISQATALRRFVASRLLDDQETHRRHHHKVQP